jgi:hypothetical protein
MHHPVQQSKILQSAHVPFLCVLYVFQKKIAIFVLHKMAFVIELESA